MCNTNLSINSRLHQYAQGLLYVLIVLFGTVSDATAHLRSEIEKRRACSIELFDCRRDAVVETRRACVIDCAEDTEYFLACVRDCKVATQNSLTQCRADFNVCLSDGRDFTVEVDAGVVDDQVCFTVDSECPHEDLEAIRVSRDDMLVHTSAPAGETGLDINPGDICLDESGVRKGTHRYAVDIVCGGEVFSGGSVSLRIRRPLLRIDGVEQNQTAYAAGDEVIIDVDLQTRRWKVNVSADFSTLDSGYSPGAETAVRLGRGRYRVRYFLSSANMRPTGDYPVPVTVSIPRSSEAAKTQTVSLRYLPAGRGTLRLVGGAFVPADMEVGVPTDPRLEVTGAQTGAVDPQQGPPLPQIFSAERGTPGGEAVVFTLSTPEESVSKVAWLEIAEQGRSGLTRIPVSLTRPLTCDGGQCLHRVQVPLQRDRSESAAVLARLAISAGPNEQTDVGPIDNIAFDSSCDSDPSTPKPLCTQPDSFEVFGQVNYVQTLMVVDLSMPHPIKPILEGVSKKNKTKQPAGEILVRVQDGCGGFIDSYTDSGGNYTIPFKSFCGDETATVTAYSITSPTAGRRVAVGLHTRQTPPQVFGDLKANPSDYTVISGQLGTFTPDADADGRTLVNGFFRDTAQGTLASRGDFSRNGEMARAFGLIGHTLRALTYYSALVSVNRLPQINIVLVDTALVPKWNTGIYSPSKSHMIHVPPFAEFSQFVIVHETAHYFHGLTIANSLTNYGGFTEPMANVMAGMINGTSWIVPKDRGSTAENMDVQGFYSGGSLVKTTFIPVGMLDCSTSVPRTNTDNCAFFFQRILWDLHDRAESPSSPSEPIDFGFGAFDFWNGGGGSMSPNNHLMNGVMLLWPPQVDGSGGDHPEYEDRGIGNMDLVDVLDGMACLYDMGTSEMSKLLRQVMGYQYDFAKCQGPFIVPQ